MDDWRLQGQEKYLTCVELERKEYQPYRDGWDHDHCEFCGAKFSLVAPGALCIGYVTSTSSHWICDSCFTDFKEKFGWTTKDNELQERKKKQKGSPTRIACVVSSLRCRHEKTVCS